MSGEGYDKYADELKDDGILIYEGDLVHPTFKKGQRSFGVPSTRIAESLGRSIVQNIVMLGFFAAATKIVSLDCMRGAVKASVPPGTEDLNLKAFDSGWAHFEEEYGKKKGAEAVVASESTA
jgi:2-oxoglutarate ferredoxin oxidoreductase subunit gamma